MTLVQDPGNPTGISDDTPRGNGDVSRARARKANAALQLRARNVDWEDIAIQLGYPSAETAQVATEKALEDGLSTPQSQEYLRTLAHLRFEELLGAVYPQALDTEHPDQLAHHDRARKTILDDMKLLGYQAPTEFTINSPSAAQIEAWISRVVNQDTIDIPEADIFEAEVVEDSDAVSAQ